MSTTPPVKAPELYTVATEQAAPGLNFFENPTAPPVEDAMIDNGDGDKTPKAIVHHFPTIQGHPSLQRRPSVEIDDFIAASILKRARTSPGPGHRQDTRKVELSSLYGLALDNHSHHDPKMDARNPLFGFGVPGSSPLPLSSQVGNSGSGYSTVSSDRLLHVPTPSDWLDDEYRMLLRGFQRPQPLSHVEQVRDEGHRQVSSTVEWFDPSLDAAFAQGVHRDENRIDLAGDGELARPATATGLVPDHLVDITRPRPYAMVNIMEGFFQKTISRRGTDAEDESDDDENNEGSPAPVPHLAGKSLDETAFYNTQSPLHFLDVLRGGCGHEDTGKGKKLNNTSPSKLDDLLDRILQPRGVGNKNEGCRREGCTNCDSSEEGDILTRVLRLSRTSSAIHHHPSPNGEGPSRITLDDLRRMGK